MSTGVNRTLYWISIAVLVSPLPFLGSIWAPPDLVLAPILVVWLAAWPVLHCGRLKAGGLNWKYGLAPLPSSLALFAASVRLGEVSSWGWTPKAAIALALAAGAVAVLSTLIIGALPPVRAVKAFA